MADLKRYKVTEKAGRSVAGRSNNGVGSVMLLTDEEAQLAVDTGQLKLMDEKVFEKTGADKATLDPASTSVSPSKEPEPEDEGEGEDEDEDDKKKAPAKKSAKK